MSSNSTLDDNLKFLSFLNEHYSHRVILRNPVSQFDSENWFRERDQIHALRKEWIESNVGSETDLWNSIHVKCMDTDGIHGIIYFFKHSHHAVLFKLTWGGSQNV